MRHRGNTLKRQWSEDRTQRSEHLSSVVCLQTSLITNRHIPTRFLSYYLSLASWPKAAQFSVGKHCHDWQSCHLHSLAPACGFAVAGPPPALSSLCELAPITKNDSVETLSADKAKKSKIFQFFLNLGLREAYPKMPATVIADRAQI